MFCAERLSVNEPLTFAKLLFAFATAVSFAVRVEGNWRTFPGQIRRHAPSPPLGIVPDFRPPAPTVTVMLEFGVTEMLFFHRRPPPPPPELPEE